MRSRDPFGEALAGLRKLLAQPQPPGRRLSVADIAAELRLSTSPVREALSRLCGEGLVEDRRGQGYFTLAPPVEDIVGLLELERAHVNLARRLAGDPAPAASVDVDAWISDLMDRCESQPLVDSFRRVRSRLAPLRRLADETRPEPCEAADPDPLEAYYGRRVAAAGTVASRLRRLEPQGPEYMRNIV